ncbi:MAG TPA: serine/threonine-protein kinase [Polyangiaceae bacterium]|nr:serine/threonine-protein kinase [Polyangiaceae bacterium]
MSRLGFASVAPAPGSRDSLIDSEEEGRAPIVEPQSESGWNAAPDAGTRLDVAEGAAAERNGQARISHAAGPISVRAPIAKIGRYALFDKFATGGMATVHLGRLDGAGGFSRVVAIKRLLPHLILNQEFAEMLLKEARLAARVRHPNVVPTLDVVALKHEVLLVLEYVHGESLSALCRAQSKLREWIPVPIVASVMIGALHGLHSVHEATDEKGQLLGLVHRDVSPPNVLIGTDGIARVLDFGIVKALEQMEETVPNRLKGKTGYMSPEQIRGERLTRSSDIFSAGIVLWELLTLRRFAPGPSDKQRLDRIARGNYQKPSEYRPSLPKAVDEVVMRALAFRPQDRYPTARDFAEALGAAVEVASPGPVADWIARLAQESLAERARLLAQVENWDDQAHPAETSAAESVALPLANGAGRGNGASSRASLASSKEDSNESEKSEAAGKGEKPPSSKRERGKGNGKAKADPDDASTSGRGGGSRGGGARAAQPSFAHLIDESKSRSSSFAPFAIVLVVLLLVIVYFSTR